MSFRKFLACMMVGATGTFAQLAWAGPAEEAAASHKKGDELLAKADFDGALKAYAAAAKVDSANQEYRMDYSVLRRVISLRESLAKETNTEKFKTGARGLHSYYHTHKIYKEALALDKQLHEKLNNADSAGFLAESQLALDKNADAEKTVSGLGDKATPQTQLLLGIAQARQKKVDEAKAVAAKVKLPADADAGVIFDVARLKALIGDKAGSAKELTRCFEMIPPSRLNAVKGIAKEDKDLASLAGTPEFAAALKAVSKVKESGCSGGSNCGSCSKKGSCASAGGDKKTCPDHKEGGEKK
jgi:hypothetical protein